MRRSTRIITASKKIVENGDSKALPKTVVKRKKTGQQQEQRRHRNPSKKNKRSASPPVNKKENVLPDRPVKKVAPARSKVAAQRSKVIADLFGSESSGDDDSIHDLCSTSSDDDITPTAKFTLRARLLHAKSR